jgi:drug/metabolite transporter (DMT)-like permease
MSSVSQAAPQARPLDAGPVSLIVLLCLFWGLNQVAIKFTLPDLPPLMQVGIRTAGGLLIVLAWTKFRGVNLFLRDGTLVPGLVAGALFALEFVFIFPGMLFTTASRASLFVYTAPFFVALGAKWLLPNERMSAVQWLGLVLCFCGLIAAIGIPQVNVDANVLFGDLMVIAGAAAWGATTLVVKSTKLATAAPEKTLIYQLAVSVPIFFVMSAIFGERVTHAPSALGLSWMFYQILVVGLTFPAWFWLIQKFSATRVSAFTILTPLFGVAAGCILLNEPFTMAFALAVVLVSAGLVLVNRRA